MLKYIFVFLIISLPIFLKAQQSLFGQDSMAIKIRENDCQDRIFTKVEELPSLKISNEEFEDSLSSALKSNKALHETDRVTFKFIITTKSQMVDLIRESGTIKKESIVKKTLLNFSKLWLPARQNGRFVCSYVRLIIIIQKDKLQIKIIQ